ncbi:HD domain-containing protein [Odoribacter sp. OttesenSCG-928-A06]|nr:HD domain-containing protein [Odoribacter sp. OttesenSCG-928-A06]
MGDYLTVTTKNKIGKDILKFLIASTPIVYIVLDKNFRMHFVNDTFTEYRRLDNNVARGKICYDLANAGKRCKECAVASVIETGEEKRIFRRDILPGGTVLHVDNYAIPLYVSDKKDFDYILEIVINRDEAIRGRQQRDADYIEIIHLLSTLLETKDNYTARHSQMVARLSVRVAKTLGLSDKDIFEIDIAASLHDIGKIFISNKIINKQDKLTEEEYGLVRNHPHKSRELLESLSGFQNVKEYVQAHHERFDGKGYPLGLVGDEIPLGARIIAVADAYNAMTTNRSYSKAIGHESALEVIKQGAGVHFDPQIVSAFLEMFETTTPVEEEFEQRHIKKFKGISREISAYDQKEKVFDERLQGVVPESKLIESIFDNVPVGYLIMDEDYNVVLANNHFHHLVGMEGKKVVGRKCYEFTPNGKKCRSCAVEKAFLTGEQQTDRICQCTPKGIEFFDAYALPVRVGGDKKYVAEILIDRTEEMELQMQHEKDMAALIKLIGDLLNDVVEENKSGESLAEIATQIASLLYIPEEKIKEIGMAASLCNIGMISMGADGVVLTDDEMYQKHAEKSWSILNQLSGFDNVKTLILHHHEHYDGSGFPDGLHGRQIPLGSRIIAIAEVIYYEDEIELDLPGLEKLKKMKTGVLDSGIIGELIRKLSQPTCE